MPSTDQKLIPTRATLDETIRSHLGAQLGALDGDPSEAKLPVRLRGLAERVVQVIRAHTEPVDQAYVDALMAALPNLRAFAISLTRDPGKAEDLIQDTILKAISSQEQFEPGTNLQAWLFTILRNKFYTAHRRSQREVEDIGGGFAATMTIEPDQDARIIHQELDAALAKLSQDQREILVLVGIDGLHYEEAAQALGIAVGTVKSRVFRARARLAELLQLDPSDFGGNRKSSV